MPIYIRKVLNVMALQYDSRKLISKLTDKDVLTEHIKPVLHYEFRKSNNAAKPKIFILFMG